MSPEYDDDNSARKVRRRSSITAAAQDALPPPVHFESLRISEDQLKACTNKGVRKFYEVKKKKKEKKNRKRPER
jgi:hypothetical protein